MVAEQIRKVILEHSKRASWSYRFGVIPILKDAAPTTATVTAAAIAAICSVQALYYNAVLLVAIGVAAVVIALRNRHWDRALVVLGICGGAAISLVPYVRTIQKAKEWNVIFSLPKYDLLLFWSKLSEALSAAGHGARWLWMGLITAAVGIGVVSQFRLSASAEVSRRQPALYCVMTLLISVPAYFLFLKLLRYPTQSATLSGRMLSARTVNSYENASVIAVYGWRPSQQ